MNRTVRDNCLILLLFAIIGIPAFIAGVNTGPPPTVYKSEPVSSVSIDHTTSSRWSDEDRKAYKSVKGGGTLTELLCGTVESKCPIQTKTRSGVSLSYGGKLVVTGTVPGIPINNDAYVEYSIRIKASDGTKYVLNVTDKIYEDIVEGATITFEKVYKVGSFGMCDGTTLNYISSDNTGGN